MDKDVVYTKKIQDQGITVKTEYSLIPVENNRQEYQLKAYAKTNEDADFKPFMQRKMNFLRLEEFIELTKMIFNQIKIVFKKALSHFYRR